MSVSGILVNAAPGDLTALSERIGDLPGVCVHYRDDDTGRLIVTLEAASLNDAIKSTPALATRKPATRWVRLPA